MLNFVWRRRHLVALATLLLVVVSPMVLAKDKIQWAESIETGLTEAQKTGKPVMMDFYTEW